MPSEPFRKLPAVSRVLAVPILADRSDWPAPAKTLAVRAVLQQFRERLSASEPLNGELSAEAIARQALDHLIHENQRTLRSVINATGIVLHTNLGRAPLADSAALAAAEAGRGYLNLELDLVNGKRSQRQSAVRRWITKLTGAESAVVVNNCAAATILALRAVAAGREVIVARGQLVEIGGSFRIPDIMAVSGAVLREIGTTNIVRIGDYAKAIGPNTAALMRVHTSNFRIRGFTASPTLPELVALGRESKIPVIDDVGSGALVDLTVLGLKGEPLAKESLAAGADVVLFSGDKLLGGPQAGIIAGKRDLISQIERDPFMRAVRPDKMTLAALEETLRLYATSNPFETIPTLKMLATPIDDLRQRANKLTELLKGFVIKTVRTKSHVGGGSLPDQWLESAGVAIQHDAIGVAELAGRLRLSEPAILGRMHHGWLVFDMRTVPPGQEQTIIDSLARILGALKP